MCPGNVGKHSVDIFAPGASIYVDGARGAEYAMWSGGTSAAAGIVAGVAALVEALDPDADPATFKDTLMRSVGDTRTPGLIPLSVSGGRVNAARAVDARGTPPLSPNGPGGAWASCDPDHDGVVLNDKCREPVRAARPTAARTPTPTASATTVTTARPRPTSPRPTTTATASATPCDPTPRGEDPDGDGKPNLDDACPTVYGTLANGCPELVTPQPTATPSPTPTATPGPAPGRRAWSGSTSR